ncbi:hypothetical protein G6F37_008391 [Rhizopus arrhizus]|nr:hypothetical protein G6F38_007327 [Rhizopus arrhizus]KAG1155603.1 hypothetical protein G6F37_008391 [Rhizopus arrhizus]
MRSILILLGLLATSNLVFSSLITTNGILAKREASAIYRRSNNLAKRGSISNLGKLISGGLNTADLTVENMTGGPSKKEEDGED